MDKKQAAIRLAWTSGRLFYLLKPVQKQIYQSIKSSKELIYVVNCSRRLGKTTTMAVIAMEAAIRVPGTQVHFGAPQQNQVKEYLYPIFQQLLADCPEDLRPTWKHFEGKWVFKNGSYIKLCGCNNKQYDNLRGNKSDLFILDEARDIDELDTVVRDIALPQLLSSVNPNKRIIIPSTPPTTPDHPFRRYAEKAKARGAYSEYTIDQAWYSKAEVDRFIEESGGRESTTSQREYFCKFVTDSSLQIIPEWNSALYVAEGVKDDYFQFYTVVEGMDVGYRDFTAWIMGWWDWREGTLYIEDELALRENEFRSDVLAAKIKEREAPYTGKNKFRRVADNNNLNILADLSRVYKLIFAPISKRSGKSDVGAKEWMVGQCRQFIKNGKLRVHPRCKMLISTLEFGIWKKNREEFERSDDLGHYDFIDALVYLISGIVPSLQNVNPVPPLYKLDVHKTMFPNGIPLHDENSSEEVLKKIFLPRL